MKNFFAKQIIVLFRKTKLNRLILSLSVPVFFAMISHMMISVSDTLMVGKLGPTAIASVGLGATTYFAIISFILHGAAGVQALTARRIGEKNYKEVGEIAYTTFYFTILSGTLITILGYFFSEHLIRLLNDDPIVIKQTNSYIYYRFLGTLFFFVFFGMKAFFDGLGLTHIGMSASIVMMFCNIVLNYLLIYGKFGFLELGIDGAAIASSISALISLMILVVFVFKKEVLYYFKLAPPIPNLKQLKGNLLK